MGAQIAAHLANPGWNANRLFTLIGSLGGVESIISYPAEMSHVALTTDERLRQGITDGTLRLSVGLRLLSC